MPFSWGVSTPFFMHCHATQIKHAHGIASSGMAEGKGRGNGYSCTHEASHENATFFGCSRIRILDCGSRNQMAPYVLIYYFSEGVSLVESLYNMRPDC